MMRTLGCGLMMLSFCVAGLDAGGAKDAVKKDAVKKDAVKKDTAKDVVKDKGKEIPKDAITGKIKSVDLKGKAFTITLATGKDHKFMVDEKTEFWGPRGGDRGTGPEGLRDRCMEDGYELRVVASKDGKTAVDVHLPFHKRDAEKDAKDKKDKK